MASRENQTARGDSESTGAAISILDVLGVDLCARAILQHVPVAQLVRSERVSRRWQRAVADYLRTCRTLSLYDVIQEYSPTSYHRKIDISVNKSSLLACKTVKKWGASIVKVITERIDEEYFEAIAMNCPNLRQIVVNVTDKDHSQLNLIKKFKQLKHICLRFTVQCLNADQVIGELFQNIDCEKIAINFLCTDLTGKFLETINKTNLKSLNLIGVYFFGEYSLTDYNLLSAKHNLRNVTSLGLDNIITNTVFGIVHLLLKEMFQLEELSLRKYIASKEMNKELIESFSRLANLKRLNMEWNCSVSDALLETLARSCRKLEHLNIRGCCLDCVGKSYLTARGLAALCRRSPSAVTTVFFGYFKDETYDETFEASCRDNPLLPELAAWCCLELTPQWWEATCRARASRGRKHPVQLNSGCNAVQAQDPRHKLIIKTQLKPLKKLTGIHANFDYYSDSDSDIYS